MTAYLFKFFEDNRRILFVFFLLIAPYSLLFVYNSMRTEAALLRRQLRISVNKMETLLKKNESLREAAGSLSGDSLDKMHWQKYGHIPFYVKNKVVNISSE
jgi:hypothetical protein